MISLALLLLASASATSPCNGVDTRLTDAQKAGWASAIAKQLNVSSVSVSQAFSFSGWRFVFVTTPKSDPPYLFFKGDPLKSRYITMWSGAATPQEESQIHKWVVQNAPGIPSKLAGCFAWQVTNGPSR